MAADSAWLTPAERADLRPAPDSTASMNAHLHDVLDHAALADEIIEELVEALRRIKNAPEEYPGIPCEDGCVSVAKAALRRVDALRNEAE